MQLSVYVPPGLLGMELLLGKVKVPFRQFSINILISLLYLSLTVVMQYSRQNDEYFPVYINNLNWFCTKTWSTLVLEKIDIRDKKTQETMKYSFVQKRAGTCDKIYEDMQRQERTEAKSCSSMFKHYYCPH